MLDEPKGVIFMEMAYSLGNEDASYMLLYHYTNKGEEDKAIAWSKIGANQVCGDCAYNLANSVDNRHNVRIRKKWMKAVARMGCERANEQLETLNLFITSDMQDLAEAFGGQQLQRYHACFLCKKPEGPG